MASGTTLASVHLHAHPRTPCTIVDSFAVRLSLASPGLLAIEYELRGALDRLRIPEAPLDPERLWEHTCCELFVATSQDASYVEWNFSPTGQLARFEFSAYRQRRDARPPVAPAPELSLHGDALRLRLRAVVPVSERVELRLAPTAVVEDVTGARSYWALRHRPDRPDFHHADGFALVLTAGPPIAIVQR